MKARPCKRCRGHRRVVVGGEVVPCPACGGEGTRETQTALFEPIMAGYEYAGQTGATDGRG